MFVLWLFGWLLFGIGCFRICFDLIVRLLILIVFTCVVCGLFIMWWFISLRLFGLHIGLFGLFVGVYFRLFDLFCFWLLLV